MSKNKDILYDYYMHYNNNTGYWNAVPRNKAVHYMNGTLRDDEILKHKSISILIEGLIKLK